MVLTEQLVDVVAVVKLLLDAEVEDAHGGRAVVARDAFAEAAVERAVLERGHDGVILLQLVEERRVDAREVARIDQRGVDALPGQQLADAVALLVEVAGGDEGHAAAAVTDAEGVEVW